MIVVLWRIRHGATVAETHTDMMRRGFHAHYGGVWKAWKRETAWNKPNAQADALAALAGKAQCRSDAVAGQPQPARQKSDAVPVEPARDGAIRQLGGAVPDQ